LKICKKFQWCYYDKQFEQNKQIEENQKLEHTNELETHTIKKKLKLQYELRRKRSQNYNNCGLYNFKNQNFGFGAQIHHLKE